MSRSFCLFEPKILRIWFFSSLVGVWHPPRGDISRGFEFLFLLSFKSVSQIVRRGGGFEHLAWASTPIVSYVRSPWCLPIVPNYFMVHKGGFYFFRVYSLLDELNGLSVLPLTSFPFSGFVYLSVCSVSG